MARYADIYMYFPVSGVTDRLPGPPSTVSNAGKKMKK